MVAIYATDGITPLAVPIVSTPLFGGRGNRWLVEEMPDSDVGTVGRPPRWAGWGCIYWGWIPTPDDVCVLEGWLLVNCGGGGAPLKFNPPILLVRSVLTLGIWNFKIK